MGTELKYNYKIPLEKIMENIKTGKDVFYSGKKRTAKVPDSLDIPSRSHSNQIEQFSESTPDGATAHSSHVQEQNDLPPGISDNPSQPGGNEIKKKLNLPSGWKKVR